MSKAADLASFIGSGLSGKVLQTQKTVVTATNTTTMI